MPTDPQDPKPRKLSRMRQSPEERRTGLLDATVRSLVKLGATGTSTRAIAEEAGVRQGLIGHYFPSKDDLIAEAYQHLSDSLFAATENAIAAADPDPRIRLRTGLITAYTQPFFGTDLLAARVALWGIAATNPILHRVHVEIYDRYRALLAELIGPLLGVTEVDDRLVFAVSSMLDGLWLERAAGKNDYDAETMIDTCLALIEGYRPPPMPDPRRTVAAKVTDLSTIQPAPK